MLRKTLITLALSFAAPLGFAQVTQTVHFKTADGVGIVGTYYPTDQPHAPAVLLVHSILRDRGVWSDFGTLLQRNGIAALAIDLRGHGGSTTKMTAQGPIKIETRDLIGQDYQDMQLDLEAANDWLQARPEINGQRIGLVAESFGANVAMRYAAINEDLAAVALFSPGINYRGVRTDDVIGQVGHIPFHLFVSQYDAFAFESAKRLIEIRQEAGIAEATNQVTVCTGSLHGAEMLKGVRNLPQILLAWLKLSLQGVASPPATPSHDKSTPPK